MESGLVSVIMPAFNAECTIEKSARSVIDQSHRDVELIIVDDGSTDRTPEICQMLAREDRRVVYHQVPNGGVSRARNYGVLASTGAFISFLDADDLYHRDKLKKQMLRMSIGDADIVTTGIQRFSEDEQGLQWLRKSYPPDLRDEPYMTLLLQTTTEHYVIFNTVLAKRDVFGKETLYDPALKTGEDWDLWIRMALRYRFASIDEPLFYYRKHKGSVTAGYGNLKTLQAHLAILEKNRRSSVSSKGFQERVDSKYLEFLSQSVYSGKYLESFRILSAGLLHGTVYKRKRFYEVIKDLLWKRLAYSRKKMRA